MGTEGKMMERVDFASGRGKRGGGGGTMLRVLG